MHCDSQVQEKMIAPRIPHAARTRIGLILATKVMTAATAATAMDRGSTIATLATDIAAAAMSPATAGRMPALIRLSTVVCAYFWTRAASARTMIIDGVMT